MTNPTEFIELLARMGLYEPLLKEHYEMDGRCACCRAGNVLTARVLWPCTTAAMAFAAKKWHAESKMA